MKPEFILLVLVVSLFTSMVSAIFIQVVMQKRRRNQANQHIALITSRNVERKYSPGLLGVAVPSFAEGLARIFDFSGSLNENNLSAFANELAISDRETLNGDIYAQIADDYSTVVYRDHRQEMLKKARRAYRVAVRWAEMSEDSSTNNLQTPLGRKIEESQAAGLLKK